MQVIREKNKLFFSFYDSCSLYIKHFVAYRKVFYKNFTKKALNLIILNILLREILILQNKMFIF